MNKEPVAQPEQNQEPTGAFDAAASLADAFTKLQNGDPAPVLEKGPVGDPGPKGAEGEQGKPQTEADTNAAPEPDKKESVVPTADAVARLRGKTPVKKEPESGKPQDDSEEMPKEADSLKKWAVNMKKDWKAEKAKREELESKLAELEKAKQAVDPSEVERLKAIVDEQERELSLSRVEATREFKEAVVQPLQQIRDLASQLAKKYDMDESEVMSALSEKDPSARSDKISDVTAGMNDADKWTLYEAQRRYAKVEGVRERVAANAKLALEKVEQHRQEQDKLQAEESRKVYGQTLSKVWSEAQEVIPLLKPVEGDDEWNGQLQQVEQFAQSVDVQNLDPDTRARVVVRSAIAPLIYGQFVALFNKYQEVEKALEKYQNATPKAGGGNSAPAGEQKVEFDDFLDALKANLR